MAAAFTNESGVAACAVRFAVDGDGAADIGPLVARRFELLLQRGNLDLDQLSRLSGIERPVFRAIIQGEVEPTVDLLWKIANALGVQIGALLSSSPPPDFQLVRAAQTRRFSSRDGGFVSRALSPFYAGSCVEFYGIALAAGTDHQFEAHAPRTTENLVVHAGSVEITIGREPPRRLNAGDSIFFQADVPHSYRNIGEETAQLYLVMTYWGLADS